MPRKKKASSALPPVAGASPPWSAQSAGSAGRLGDDEPTKESHNKRVVWDPDLFSQKLQSEQSTAASLGISRDDASKISQMLDDSLHAVSSFSAAPESAPPEDDWEVQRPEDIISEVTRYVEERKPWRQKLDDSVLDQKHNERQDRLERGFHIILPDNRVRVMEDELSFRVRCSLLDIDPLEVEPPPTLRRTDKNKRHNQKMRMNPWYLKPASWYSLKEKLKAEEDAENSYDFPYANVILNLPEEPKTDDAPPAPQMTPFAKENLDMYKQYMKGNRLPHFLQDKQGS